MLPVARGGRRSVMRIRTEPASCASMPLPFSVKLSPRSASTSIFSGIEGEAGFVSVPSLPPLPTMTTSSLNVGVVGAEFAIEFKVLGVAHQRALAADDQRAVRPRQHFQLVGAELELHGRLGVGELDPAVGLRVARAAVEGQLL